MVRAAEDAIPRIYRRKGKFPRPGPAVERFSIKDEDNQWLSLRYDLTAPLARYVAEHYEGLAKPFRSYRSGWVFRNEKPGRAASGSSCSSMPIQWGRRARRGCRCA